MAIRNRWWVLGPIHRPGQALVSRPQFTSQGLGQRQAKAVVGGRAVQAHGPLKGQMNLVVVWMHQLGRAGWPDYSNSTTSRATFRKGRNSPTTCSTSSLSMVRLPGEKPRRRSLRTVSFFR